MLFSEQLWHSIISDVLLFVAWITLSGVSQFLKKSGSLIRLILFNFQVPVAVWVVSSFAAYLLYHIVSLLSSTFSSFFRFFFWKLRFQTVIWNPRQPLAIRFSSNLPFCDSLFILPHLVFFVKHFFQVFQIFLCFPGKPGVFWAAVRDSFSIIPHLEGFVNTFCEKIEISSISQITCVFCCWGDRYEMAFPLFNYCFLSDWRHNR